MSSLLQGAAPVQRAYRYRLYPTAAQRLRLEGWFGAARWVWNRSLEFRTKAYRRRKESVTGVDFSRLLTCLKRTARYGWLRDTPATVLTQKLRDQDRAFANFFAGRAKYPRFRKRRTAQSIRFQLDRRCIHRTCDANDRRLALPGLGPLRLRWSRRPHCADSSDAPGCKHCPKPRTVTVRRDAAGRWFVSFMVEEAMRAAERVAAPNPIVAVDLGLKDLLTDSDGGRVARLHARVADARANFLHRVSRRLVDENQAIVTETLNVRGMVRNRRLARAIADAGWGELVRQIAYKAQWAGRVHVQVDPWFPSTKRCSACHAVRGDLTLKDRRWRCRCVRRGARPGRERGAEPAAGGTSPAERTTAEGARSVNARGGWTLRGVPAQAVNEPAPVETRTDSTRLKRYGTAEAA